LMPFVRATLVINASTARTYAFFVSPRRGHFPRPPHDTGAGKPARELERGAPHIYIFLSPAKL
jgi:hypothetical protein